MKNIYDVCPIYKKELITLRQTVMEDAEDLLNCYSDEKSVPLFNSDNCNGDDFHYKTLERMQQAISFWDYSYKHKYFVRWTIIKNDTKEKIGTVEMFHRLTEDEFNHYGMLRIDLQSKYEIQTIINEILQIVDENFYDAFDVRAIVTKAKETSPERVASLLVNGYKLLGQKFVIYDDYYVTYSHHLY